MSWTGVSRGAALVLVGLLGTACSSFSPGQITQVDRPSQPIFEEVSLQGLVFRDVRVAGHSVGSSSSFGTTTTNDATHTPFGSLNTTGTGTTNSSGVSSSTHYETYDNYEVQDAFRREIEDKRIARRVVRGAHVRIEGHREAGGPSTGVGRMAWNTFNTITLLGLFGLPYLGSSDASVQLRVYEDHELIGSYEGHGKAYWRHTMYGIVPGLPGMRSGSTNLASHLATQDALARLVEDPPQLRRRPETDAPPPPPR
jgi:hypothetical protein